MRMKKEEKVVIGLSIFILLVIFATISITIFDFNIASLTGGCPTGSTGTITSISETTLKSNEPLLDGQDVWLVEFRGLESAQCLWGDFAQVQDGGEQSTDGFELGIKTLDQNCVYSYGSLMNTPIYNVEIKSISSGGNQNYAMTECVEAYPTRDVIDAVLYDYIGPWYHTACILSTEKNPVSSISATREYEWSVEAILHSDKENKDYTATLDSAGTSSTLATDWQDMKAESWNKGAIIKWAGNLIGQYDCPDSSGFLIRNKEETISKQLYDEYLNHLTGAFRICVDRYELSSWDDEIPTGLTNCVYNLNTYANRAKGHSPFCTDGIGGDLCEEVSYGEIKVDTKYIIPSFQMMIKASVLGIYQGVGEPEVVSFTVTDFDDAGSGSATALFRNAGGGTGSFDTWVTCATEGVYCASAGRRIGLEPSETEQISFTIKGDVPDGDCKSFTCTAHMRETTSQVEKTKSASAEICDEGGGTDPKCYDDPQIAIGDSLCVPDESSRAWKECLSDGTWDPNTCDINYHCEMIGGQASCQPGGPTCGDGICESSLGENEENCPEDCGGIWNYIKQYWWLIVIAIVIGFVAWYYYGGEKGWNSPFNRNNNRRRY